MIQMLQYAHQLNPIVMRGTYGTGRRLSEAFFHVLGMKKLSLFANAESKGRRRARATRT